MRLYVDTWTGQLRRTTSGALVGPMTFVARDILPLEIVFVTDGVDVTSTVLAGGAVMKVGLKAYPGATVLLALGSDYILAAQVATLTLPLDTQQLVDFLAQNAAGNSTTASFEIEVTNPAGTNRQTYHQRQSTLKKEVNATDDVAPSGLVGGIFSPLYVWFRSAITQLTGGGANALDSLDPTTFTVPTALMLKVTGAGGQLWVIEPGVDAEDGEWIVRPDNYAALVVKYVWRRYI